MRWALAPTFWAAAAVARLLEPEPTPFNLPGADEVREGNLMVARGRFGLAAGVNGTELMVDGTRPAGATECVPLPLVGTRHPWAIDPLFFDSRSERVDLPDPADGPRFSGLRSVTGITLLRRARAAPSSVRKLLITASSAPTTGLGTVPPGNGPAGRVITEPLVVRRGAGAGRGSP